MSGSPSPSPSRTLPCQQDPERWFDRRRRGDALALCFTCAARPWCARQALKWCASWGVWAGVWIDGRHDDALPYLQAIAADGAAPIDVPSAHAGPTISTAAPTPAPLRPPTGTLPSRATPAAAVLARSSGHCEVFTESCRYTLDRVVSRRRGDIPTENPSPAELFGTCRACAEVLARLQPQLATRSGYIVDAGRDPAGVPFRWRGSRWVLLDRGGWLTELGENAQTA